MNYSNARAFKAAENLTDDLVIELAKSIYDGTNGYDKNEKIAKTMINRVAAKGNLEAQYMLYNIYDNEDDNKEAIKWLKMAANRGHIGASLTLFYEYIEGNVSDINEEKIRGTIMEAANKEDPNAMFIVSELYEQGGHGIEKDYNLARVYCKGSAELGCPLAQYKMYKYLISEDKDVALVWLKKAAQNDDEEAQYQLWLELSKEAYNWLDKAYMKQYPDAMYDFARLQETDVFMKRDFEGAKDTYTILSLLNIRIAAERLIEYGEYEEYNKEYKNLTNLLVEYEAYASLAAFCFNQIKQGVAVNENIEILEKAAESDSSEALYTLSIVYKFADELENCEKYHNTLKANKYLLKSANLGNIEAEETIFDEFYRGEKGLNISEKEALKYLHSSAEKGNPSALNLLGVLHYYGRMVGQDEIKAYDYFAEAAKKDFDFARYNLGKLYESAGKFDEAIKHYSEAASNGEPYSMKKIVELWEKGYIDEITKESIDEIEAAYNEIGFDREDLKFYLIN